MRQLMEANLLFDTPSDGGLAVAELTKLGFAVEFLDWVDEWEGVVLSETVWIRVRGASELDEDGFFNEMASLAEQFNGDVGEAGLADPCRRLPNRRDKQGTCRGRHTRKPRAARRSLARRVGPSKKPKPSWPRCAPARLCTCSIQNKARAGRCPTAGRYPTPSPSWSSRARALSASAMRCSMDTPPRPFRWWRET